MATVSVRVTDSQGNSSEASTEFSVLNPTSPVRVAGGVYFGGNADVRPDTINRTPPMQITALQQYRSLADGSQYPGWQKQWVHDLVADGVWLNFVSELKHYGAANSAQTFTVEGRSYMVPAPQGTIQRRPDTTFPVAYSYDQVLSGAIDGLLHRLLSQLRSIPTGGRINIQLASEVDTDNEFGTSHGSIVYNRVESDLKAVAAYGYIADWLRSPPSGIAGIPNGVTLSVGYAGQWSGIDGFKRTHSEELMQKLDYLHMNTYNHSSNRTAEYRFREITEWAAQLGPIGRSKNIIVSEFGSNANFTPDQAGYIGQVPAAIAKLNGEMRAADRGQFVMTIWFSSRDSTWGTLSPKEAGLVALTNMLDTPPYSEGA